MPNEDSVGLGLWICKTFVDALDGTIAVDSTRGEGTTFTIRFDRADLETPSGVPHASSS